VYNFLPPQTFLVLRDHISSKVVKMSPEVTAVVFGIAAALLWGSGDFSGGIATKRTSVFTVLIISQLVGLVLMIGLVLLTGESAPTGNSLLWAGAAGISGGIGVAALYQALAMGQMGIAAPLAAVFTAAIPVLVGILTEGLPGVAQFAGFGLALVSIWILVSSEKTESNRRGLGLALLAGVGFGMLLVGLDRAGESAAVYWPLMVARISSLIFMTIVATLRRNQWQVDRKLLPIIATAGFFDVMGNAAYVAATQAGRLDVAAVLASLYPAATVILAGIFLKERLSRSQMVAISMVLFSIVLIALPQK
jgi:drug/metabolite transporter (DMT)-like permease